MSQSLIAKRISDTMALASDSLFDKFGLLDPVVMGDPDSDPSPDTSAGISDFELPFEDLDFGDLLEVKQEPLYESVPEATSTAASSTIIEDNNDLFEAINTNADPDPFFSMESLMDDASLDSIKSDCMWSSVNLFAQENSRKRRRDVSLTLSECAEGFLSINSFDVNMLDSLNTPSTNMMNIDDESASVHSSESEMMANSEDEEADEEIDVVGTDLGGSSARTRHCYRPNKDLKKHRSHHRIEAGRSLLKRQQPSTKVAPKISSETVQQQTIDKHRTQAFLDDHCYFLARPEKDIKPLKGMLTPNESSEEDEDQNEFITGQTTCNMVDKRKIAEAVQSLIKNRPASASEAMSASNVKFRFRMKFKSTLAANNMKKAVKCEAEEFRRERRKSASRNAFCPPPSASERSSTTASNNQIVAHHAKPSKKRSLLAASNSKMNNNQKGESEKCREVRDLHNSMERQRRVEQRNHLAYLKKQVPEVADLDKASKLTILRKATDYCHLLSNMDNRIRKEKDKESNRSQMLKKKLADLKARQDARRSTGRYRY
jgi:hypothetical protein